MGSSMDVGSVRQDRQYSDLQGEQEIGTGRQEHAAQRTQPRPQSNGIGDSEALSQSNISRRNSQNISGSNSSVRPIALPFEVGPGGPSDDPTTRGEGRHRYLQRHHITGKLPYSSS